MEYIYVCLMLVLSLFTIKKMISSRSVVWLMIGIVGTFSIGYYVLPVFFKKAADLDMVDSNILNDALLMSVLFFASLIIGVLLFNKKTFRKKIPSLKLNMLDGIYKRNYKLFYILGFIIWLVHYFNSNISVYEAADAEAYFHTRSTFDGLISALSNFGLSAVALSTAIALEKKEKKFKVMIFFYLFIVLLLLATGQRLAVIKPVFMLVAAMAVLGNYKKGIKIIFVGVAILFLVSPLMVFVREYHGVSGKSKFIAAASEYSSDDLLETGLNSIMKRADLLLEMTELKIYIDRNENKFDLEQYLFSVLTAFVPRILYPSKPHALSDDGTIWGEISVISWVLKKGDMHTGSLSAFGAITAYREGGWLWIPFNGLLTAFLFVWISIFLGKGGLVSKLFFVSLFSSLCVKNIPPSLFYFLFFIAAAIQLLFVLYIINLVLRRYKLHRPKLV